jgi:NitT/TauT family transport system ATP-binding protein
MTSNVHPICVEDLGKSYDPAKPIIAGFNLEILTGTTTAILGPSGCGKSTLLRLLCGLEEPTKGRVLLNGGPAMLSWRTGSVSLLSSDASLLPWRTVFENVKLPMDLMGRKSAAIDDKCRQVLERLQIMDLSDRFPHTLSDGQRQRLRLAQSMVTDPAIVLLDEPFSSLDEGLRRLLLVDLVKYMSDKSRTSILVTHYAFEAARTAEKVLIYDGPPLTQCGAPIIIDVPAVDRSIEYVEERARDISAELLKIAMRKT